MKIINSDYQMSKSSPTTKNLKIEHIFQMYHYFLCN